MEAKGISIACCAVLALALGACSGDSQPTGPEMGGDALNRVYYDASGSTYDGSGSSSESSSSTSSTSTWQGSAADGSDAPPPASGTPDKGTGSGSVMTYPISRFLASQGTFCADNGMGGCAYYMLPTENYLGFVSRTLDQTAVIDYAGIANNWLSAAGRSVGTFIDGTVTEEPLPDGTARVTVRLHGANVMAYVVNGPDLEGELAFGQSTRGVYMNSEKPALGSVQMTVTFINPRPGMQLPDLMQLVRAPEFGQRIESMVLVYDGDGVMQPSTAPAHLRVVYDGSGGPLMQSHPDAPKSSTVVGRGDIVYSPTAVS